MKSNLKLAALGLMALGLTAGQAEACSTGAWSDTSGAVLAGGPTDPDPGLQGVLKLRGACGLQTPASGVAYVEESVNHAAEGGTSPYHARFFVHTGGSSATIFQAFPSDVSGTPVVSIAYDSVDQNFDFNVNGGTLSTAAGSAPANRWVAVYFTYDASTSFTAATRTGRVRSEATGSVTPGAATIEAVRLGQLAGGGTGVFNFDEFESSRAASVPSGPDGPFTMVCNGDANGSGTITAADRAAITAEIAGTAASGQTDCNENGSVTAGDRACVTNLIGTLADCTSGTF
ncbi:dockerin type I domain-containing protein [Pseudomarimonas arenosa]|uniref:Secreted protein n=1 Tax=Pseudomarimonas arenosa TaxID=2774145 RepID=A0AAW3ZP90_9GAMM|nr:dockerin type I domain-containing protein [Pseudomarimonas arenosa]MBD8527329.1 hypothetical protein [Pseudomarimonas arenosa]